ncbi:nuclear transport factor 2 family protein [Angustibacter sp. McL0619]|uniref:nuclear transport factor 2 family protein n=1 Tax=Angustibacter sp. McL0619 TaxID=3415676 RepID=UPI003CE976C5
MSHRTEDLTSLIDKANITELLTRYLRAIDRGDIATLRACYLEGAYEEHGGLYAGPAQGYVDSIERSLTHPRSVVTHSLSNILIDVRGDQARSEHYVLAMTRIKADGVLQDSLIASRIVDDLQRSAGGWAIARRRLRFDWARELGPVSTTWLQGVIDPTTLLYSGKYPEDPVYDDFPAPLLTTAEGTS